MEEVFEIVIRWAVPIICSTIIGIGTAIYKKSAKEVKAVGVGVQALLRAEIIRCHKEYVRKGFCPVYARDALERTYHAYHDLGGNDVASSLYKEIMALPTEEDLK